MTANTLMWLTENNENANNSMPAKYKAIAGWATYISVTIATLGLLAKIAGFLVGFGIQLATFQSHVEARFNQLERKIEDNQRDNAAQIAKHEERLRALESHNTNRN